MKIADIPTKFTIPFANAAGGGYIRSVPQASQIGITNGAASLTDGFPPLTFLPVGSGGVPPFGQDFNGLLKQVTQWNRWAGAGGVAAYDSAFSTAIGGYPLGSILAGAAGIVYISTVDDNTSNPTTGGAGWSAIATATTILNNSYTYAADTGGAGAIVATLTPAPSGYVTGMSFRIKVAANCSGATTVNLNGLGPIQAADKSGANAVQGLWQNGDILEFVYDGTKARVVAGNNVIATSLVTSNSTTTSVSNNVATQIPLTSGSASFGAIASNNLTFTRAGTYFVAITVSSSETFTGPGNVFALLSIRNNGTEIPGGFAEDGNYGTTSTIFKLAASVLTNFAVGDVLTGFATVSATSGFSAASLTGASINAVQIS